MKKIFSFLIVLMFASISSSQFYVKPRAIVASPNSCASTAVIEAYGINFPHFMHNAASQQVFNGDTITNFCFYENGNPSNESISGFSSNGYLNNFQVASTLVLPDYNYVVNSFVEPTNETSMDGSLTIVFDSAVTSYNYFFEQDGGYIPTITVVDAYTIEVTNMNKTFLTVQIENSGDIYDYVSFRIYPGDPSNIYVNTGMNVNVSFQHAGFSCTGWINLQATPPGTYYNAWSDDVVNTTTRTDLCPGVYGVYSYDMIAGEYNTASIDTVVITNDSLTYIDTNLYSIIPQDTSYYFTQDCFFDYYQPIDSIVYTEDTIFYSDPLLIATFQMIIYQGSNMITFSDSLVTLADSTVLLDVVVYCELFKSPFTGQRIMFLRGAEDHFFESPFLDLTNEKESQQSLVYPNPTNSHLTISFEKSEQRNIAIVDLQGNVVFTENVSGSQNEISIDHLASGTYILLIQSVHGAEQHLIVKT